MLFSTFLCHRLLNFHCRFLADGLYAARTRLYLLRAIIRLGSEHVVFLVAWERSHLMWDGCPVSYSTCTFIHIWIRTFLSFVSPFAQHFWSSFFFRDLFAFLQHAGTQPFAFVGVCSCPNCTAYGRRLSARLRYHNSVFQPVWDYNGSWVICIS